MNCSGVQRSGYILFVFLLLFYPLSGGWAEESGKREAGEALEGNEEREESEARVGSSGSNLSDSAPSLKNMRIGVIPFRAAEAVTEGEAEMISQILLTGMSERNAFEIVELGDEEFKKEATLQLTGFVADEKTLNLGKRLDLKYLLTGICVGSAKAGNAEVKSAEAGNAETPPENGGAPQEEAPSPNTSSVEEPSRSRKDPIRLTVRLTEIEAGKAIYGKTQELSRERIERDLQIYVGELAHGIESSVLGRSLDEIETLLRLHMWEKAYAAVKEYEAVHGQSPRVRELKKRLFSELTRVTRRSLEESQEYAPPHEWIKQVPLFLSYSKSPSSVTGELRDIYRRFYMQIEQEWNKEKEKIVDAIEKEHIKYAGELLEEAREKFSPITHGKEKLGGEVADGGEEKSRASEYSRELEMNKLERRIDLKKAQIAARKARFFYRTGEYRQASYYTQKAIRLQNAHPDYERLLSEKQGNGGGTNSQSSRRGLQRLKELVGKSAQQEDYIELLKKIEKARESKKERQSTVEAKDARWAPSRRGNNSLYGGVASTFLSDEMNRLYIEGSFPKAELMYEANKVIIPPLNRALHGGVTMSRGENTTSGGGNKIDADFTHIEAVCAVSASLRFTRFEFALEGRAGLGMLFRRIDFGDITPGKENRKRQPTLSWGLRGDIRYALGNHLLLGLGVGVEPLYVIDEGRAGRFSASGYAGWRF